MHRKEHLTRLRERLQALGPLTPAAWEELATHLRVNYFRANRYLPLQPDAIYYVSTGLIKEEWYTATHVDHIQRFVQSGEFMVDEAQGERSGHVTLTDTTLLSLSPDRAHAVFGRHPVVGKLYVQILRLCHASLDQRLRLLLLPKRERYAAFLKALPGLAPQLLDKDIMRYLDISPGYFSRTK